MSKKDSLRERLLAMKPEGREPVEISGFDGELYVRPMTVAERGMFEEALLDPAEHDPAEADPQASGQARAAAAQRSINRRWIRSKRLIVMLTLVDEHGARVFRDTDEDGLLAIDGKVLERLYDAVERLNGLGTLAEATAKKN